MAKEIGIGIVGLGMGANRARMATETPGVKLVAVCDVNEERAKTVSERHGCDMYLDYAKMLERDDVDVVHVMTWSGLHADHGMMAARAGKHVITTKPMDVTVAKCDALIEECRKAGVKLAVDFDSRYGDTWHTIKRAVDEGVLGKLVLGEARLKWFRTQGYYDDGGWRGTWKWDGGGALANQTVHFIDLLQWMMGFAETVYGDSGVYTHKIEGEDMGLAILRFKNGARGAIVGTTTFPQSPYCGVEIHGDKGGVLTTKKETQWYWLEGYEPGDFQAKAPAMNVQDNMARAINEGLPIVVTGEEGRKSVVLLEAIRESAKSGQVVRVKD